MAIKIKDDGSIVADGVSYKDKAAYKAREKTKKTGNIFEGRLTKEKRTAKASEAQGKANAGATIEDVCCRKHVQICEKQRGC
jgi:hypothetical protein